MSVIDEVKSRIDIVDLISEHLTLRRAGRNFRALCPFHSERTPSFHVSPERQTWHCFGACAEGGDIFNFVMKREGVEFPEALRLLAERAGVTLADRREPQEDERRQRLQQANEAAAAFFHNALLHSKPGESARAYLASRGLDTNTIEAFQLGYSPESWDALKTHLTDRGFTNDELLAAGLVVESERGGYDRFRGRLMFPISDDRGRMAGFGARTLAPAEESAADGSGAKYINTPQTALFDKSSLLYALDRAKEASRREESVIVVEGYMDVIAAHQHGITNVVASMGTALTERQIRALERLKGKILLALDSDAAGIEATLRALQEAEAAGAIRAGSASAHPAALAEEDFSKRAQEWSRNALKRATVNFYVLPLSGKDPDEMIRADRSAWDAAVAAAKPFTDHVFEIVAARKDLTKPDQRSELLRELLPVVRLVEEPVYRAHYLQRLARLAQIEEDAVRAELGRHAGRPTRPAATAPEQPLARRELQEEFCLALLLHHPELRPEASTLSPGLFLLSEHRAIFAAWRETSDMEAIRRAVSEELHPQLERITSRGLPVLEGTQLREALADCVAKIETDRLRQAKLARSYEFAETSTLEKESEPAYVEDMEQGRRLHQLTAERRRVREQRLSPQAESDR